MSRAALRSKAFWAGVLFIFFGAADLWLSRAYPMGTLQRMGPAYFPVMMGLLLCGLGMMIMMRAVFAGGEPVARGAVRPFLVLAAVVLFALMVRPAGVVLATIVLIAVGSSASREVRLHEVVLLALAMATIAVVVFAWGLQLRVPIWPGG